MNEWIVRDKNECDYTFIVMLAYIKIVSELLTAICHHLWEMMLDRNVSEVARHK